MSLKIALVKIIPTFHRGIMSWLNMFDTNPLRAKFIKGNINMYLHLILFLHINMTQAAEIPPCVKQGSTLSSWLTLWVPMTWRRKEHLMTSSWWFLQIWTFGCHITHRLVNKQRWHSDDCHQVIISHRTSLVGDKPLSQPMLEYY